MKVALTDGKSYGKTASFTVGDDVLSDETIIDLKYEHSYIKHSQEVTITLNDNQIGIDYTKSKFKVSTSKEPIGVNGSYSSSITRTEQTSYLNESVPGTYYLHR